MSAPKVNTPVGAEERQHVTRIKETPVDATLPVAIPKKQASVENVTANMEDENPFTSEERIPSFWSIEACGNGITATHRNGRVFRGTPKQFSGLLKA